MDMTRHDGSGPCLSGKTAVYLFRILKRNLVCRELRNTFLVLLHLSNSFLAANISKVSLPRKTASKKSLAHLP